MERNIYLHSLPAELLQFIFSHCSLVSLMQISATCHRLRLQVHEFFKRRLSKQAAVHPEVKESLARIGWKKEHQLWTCDCFKLVAGPGLAWSRLNKQDSFTIKSNDSWSPLSDISTTVAGKIFVVTFSRNIIFWETDSNKNKLEKLNSPGSLVSFESGLIDILSSYDNVLAFSRFDDKGHRSINIFNPSALYPVTEVVLKLSKYVHEVNKIVFAKDTMVVEYLVLEGNLGTNIDIWKLDTKNPRKEGIELLNTISHRYSPNTLILHQDLCVNDRFMAVADQDEIKVFQGYQDSVVDPLLIRQSRRSYVLDVAMEKGQGHRIAAAFRKDTKIVLKVYSAINGRRIMKFEKISKQHSDLCHLEWFGEHLIVVTQEKGSLSMMTWQPSMSSLLTCPLNGSVVGPSSFDEWEILNVGYQGITIAFRDNGYCLSDAHMFFEIWNSKEKTVNGNTRSHIGSRHHPGSRSHHPHSPSHHHRQSHNRLRSRSHHSTSRSHHRPFRNHHPHSPSHHRPSRSHHLHSPSAHHPLSHNRLRSPSHHQPHSQSHHPPSRSRHLQPHSHSYHRPSRSQNYRSPSHHHSQSHHRLSRIHHQPHSQSHHRPSRSHHRPSRSHHRPSRSHHRPSHSSHHPHSPSHHRPSHNRDRRSPSFHRLSRSQRSPSRRHHHHSSSHPHPSRNHPHPSPSHPHPSRNHPHPSRNHHHSSSHRRPSPSQYPHSARRSRSRSGRRTRL